jgi:hypothetical protein
MLQLVHKNRMAQFFKPEHNIFHLYPSDPTFAIPYYSLSKAD